MNNPVGWFEIYVSDMSRAKKFYGEVFGYTFEKISEGEVDYWKFQPESMDAYGCGGALIRMGGVAPGGGGTLVYFATEDCQIAESKVEAAGGRVHKPKMSIGPYGFISLVVDTESNMIGIHSMK